MQTQTHPGAKQSFLIRLYSFKLSLSFLSLICGLKKTIRVVALLEKRMDAKSVVAYYEDLTPPEETQAFKSAFLSPMLARDRGAGRPTKKDRREIDELQEGWFEED